MNRIKIICTLMSALVGGAALAQEYVRVKIFLDPVSTQLIAERGLETDHGIVKKGVFLINDFDSETLDWLRQSGIRHEILVEDVKSIYQGRNFDLGTTRDLRTSCFTAPEDTITTPFNFTLGSMGGFYTYEEFLDELDKMHDLFPNLITEKQPIDTFLSHEGRPIYFVNISDNPQLEEGEPEVLYTALHHAREPQSLTQLVFYMWYLLEQYENNEEIKDLVDATNMFFIPMINPDGYVFNQSTEPGGGGMWRKNRRNNGNGSFGVDLNRNYAFNWGLNNQGSSPNTSSETYRGPEAFSEPETRAVKWLCESRSFKLALNYHSFGNYLIYPWGSVPSLTPDSNIFISIAEEMTRYNNYLAGTGIQTVGYTTNGDSDDWMYGEQGTKDKMFSMTPEVGNQGDGFWPEIGRIEPLSKENLHPNLMLAHLAGDYAVLNDNSEQMLESLNGQIQANALRIGLDFNGPYIFELVPMSENIASVGAAVQLTAMDLSQAYPMSFSYTLAPQVSPGDLVTFDLLASFNGKTSRTRIVKTFGTTMTVLSNAGNLDDFLTGSNWNLTSEYFVSADFSFTDSPFANYQNNQVNEFEYNRIVDLRSALTARLRLQARWEIEDGWDYAQVLASPVFEDNWTPLCGLYTEVGNSFQDEGQPLWDGIQTEWVEENLELDDYIGQRIKLKFRMVSDQFVNFDGFYFDDMELALILDENSEFPLDSGYLDTLGAGPVEPPEGFNQRDAMRWQVFPNPANSFVKVKVRANARLSATLQDLSGRVVLAAVVENGFIDVGSVPSGVYLLRLSNENHSQVHKLSIVR